MSLFVPDPDDFDLEELIESLGFELAERYRDAEDELILQLATRIYRDLELQQMQPTANVRGPMTAAQRREQNRVLALIAQHRANSIRELRLLALQIVDRIGSHDLAAQLIELASTEGEAAAAARLGFARRLPIDVVPLSFVGSGTAISATTLNGTATQAVAQLVFSLRSRLDALNQRITRYPQDAYQQIVSLVSPRTLLGVSTSLQQQQATVQLFLRNGITGFTDRANRNWRIGSYAEMAGRTSVNRAFNDAGIYRMQQSGINLVTIVGGFDACKRCAPWIGKILSTDGTPAGPVIVQHSTEDRAVIIQVAGTIDQARNAGWNHPNCRDKAVAYLPGLSVPQSGFEYNAAAEKEREKQRALERAIRSAKRDLATAPNDIARQAAARELAEAQADMREFIERTGRARRSYREQLAFADGR